ncbi:unnamed protein product [Ixodes hexagonus]
MDSLGRPCALCSTIIFVIDCFLCIFVVSVTKDWNTQACVFLFASLGSLASLGFVLLALRSRSYSFASLQDVEARPFLLTSSHSNSLKTPSLPVPSWTQSSAKAWYQHKDKRGKGFFSTTVQFPRPAPVHDRDSVKIDEAVLM